MKVVRIDEFCKEFGLIEAYKAAYLREGNFAHTLTPDEMVEEMEKALARFERENIPLHEQLAYSFVFRCTPQGEEFWWDVYRKAAMTERVLAIARGGSK